MNGSFTLAVGTNTIEEDGAKYQKASPAPSRRGRPFRCWITYWVGCVFMNLNPNITVSKCLDGPSRRPQVNLVALVANVN
jgi:hypothetical protein